MEDLPLVLHKAPLLAAFRVGNMSFKAYFVTKAQKSSLGTWSKGLALLSSVPSLIRGLYLWYSCRQDWTQVKRWLKKREKDLELEMTPTNAVVAARKVVNRLHTQHRKGFCELLCTRTAKLERNSEHKSHDGQTRCSGCGRSKELPEPIGREDANTPFVRAPSSTLQKVPTWADKTGKTRMQLESCETAEAQVAWKLTAEQDRGPEGIQQPERGRVQNQGSQQPALVRPNVATPLPGQFPGSVSIMKLPAEGLELLDSDLAGDTDKVPIKMMVSKSLIPLILRHSRNCGGVCTLNFGPTRPEQSVVRANTVLDPISQTGAMS